ncbi:hypothetical protein HMPREF1017_00775 [Bacteroides ovatus 3_8_47FAA]|uniref:hypothetical protein n=1 Tax=Bacteroides ovatus TaxID=28116 RepID=UPI0002132122|nr:hypothetical protein [Bacteroides ovatus]EGN00249.1 hypothetical protein HMPREF1017_00775 [Bacteroides ovatus 3_8_47FAA]QGT70231.1 hypothetical protein FOC41_04300 [Bacteroides ovatus]
MDIVLNIKKANVYDEVAKLTGYVGAKTIEDTGKAYDRVFTTDDDRLMLERFWREAVGAITDEIKRFITNVSTQANAQTVDISEVWTANLEMPSNFDDNLIDSINDSLFSYAVNSIVSKWFAITNKEEANMYSGMAVNCGNEAKSKLYYRKKPKRVVPSI